MSSPAVRIALVGLGGTIGTGARLLLGAGIPELAGIPVGTLAANVLGSLLLGVLAARLPGSSSWRVFLGTGVLGGFTTYSAFAVGSVALWHTAPALAAAYAAGSLALGIGAAALGLRLGARKERRG